MRTRLEHAILVVIALTSVLLIAPAKATPPDDWEWPDKGVGVSGEDIRDMIVYDDGSGAKLYVGGVFGSAGGVPAAGVTRWNGESWSLFGGLAGFVFVMLPFDDGSGQALYAGGEIGSAGGMAAKNIARWNGEKWSPVGQNLQSPALALAVYDDGLGPKLYAGGGALWRWDPPNWTKILGPMTPPIDIRAMAVFDDGSGAKLFVGGWNSPWIAAWDGQAWTSIGLPPGYFGIPMAMVSFDDGPRERLFVSGPFFDQTQSVAIFTWDGATWTAVPTGLSNSASYHDFVMTGKAPGAELFAIGPPSAVKWDRGTWSSLAPLPSGSFALCGEMFDDGMGPRMHLGGSIHLAGKWTNIARETISRPQCGDLNGDGVVNQQDLGILLSDWGCTKGVGLCPGDCDNDGDTDQSDLGILLSNWGQPCP